jgi:hypothetical protein
MSGSFDELVEGFEAIGLTRDAALVAAVGRGRTERQARAEHAEADRIRAAEAHADAALLAPAGQAPPVDAETRAVAEAARARLGMTPVDGLRYAAQLRDREAARAGAEHARRWLAEFARSLNPPQVSA